MDATQILPVGLAIVLLGMLLLWLVGLRSRDLGTIDVFWGLGFVAAAWILLLIPNATQEPLAVVGDEPRDRELLLAQADDVVRIPWTAAGDPSADGASGEVVWSDRWQQGYLRVRGLAANDPQASQYQLWIFDATRDPRYPVDGGVFDIRGAGEAFVAIRARLPVEQATRFAVTVERPGGVVVSSRERLALQAAVPG